MNTSKNSNMFKQLEEPLKTLARWGFHTDSWRNATIGLWTDNKTIHDNGYCGGLSDKIKISIKELETTALCPKCFQPLTYGYDELATWVNFINTLASIIENLEKENNSWFDEWKTLTKLQQHYKDIKHNIQNEPVALEQTYSGIIELIANIRNQHPKIPWRTWAEASTAGIIGIDLQNKKEPGKLTAEKTTAQISGRVWTQLR